MSLKAEGGFLKFSPFCGKLQIKFLMRTKETEAIMVLCTEYAIIRMNEMCNAHKAFYLKCLWNEKLVLFHKIVFIYKIMIIFFKNYFLFRTGHFNRECFSSNWRVYCVFRLNFILSYFYSCLWIQEDLKKAFQAEGFVFCYIVPFTGR